MCNSREPVPRGRGSGERAQKARPFAVIAQMRGKSVNELFLAGAGLCCALCQYYRDRPEVDGEEF